MLLRKGDNDAARGEGGCRAATHHTSARLGDAYRRHGRACRRHHRRAARRHRPSLCRLRRRTRGRLLLRHAAVTDGVPDRWPLHLLLLPGHRRRLPVLRPQVTSTSTFYTSHEWYTHPDYVDADWPYTQDFVIVILDQPVYLDQYVVLPEVGLLDELIPATGQTDLRFTDVGYGQTGVTVGGGPPQRNFPLERRQAVQRYAPGGEGGIGHGLTDLFLFLQNVPSEPHGSACGGDSGSPVFLGDTNQLVAVHTGGYRLGPGGVICGRLTSLNHRLDTEVALEWINSFL